jgi:hypothetical protein|tara:strand:+ start:13975 stop:14364 length:390 start_codon:yes stop_codon:yes gene_type:complete
MRNFKNNRRRFRSNSFERNFRINSNDQNLSSSFGNVSDFKIKKYSKNNFNSPKLIQKYSNLAREALSSGDKILYENYLQHAEHFIRNSSNFSNGNAAKNGHSQGADETNVSKINKEDFKQEDKLEEKKS